MRSRTQTLAVMVAALGLASAILGLTIRPRPHTVVTVTSIQGAAAQQITREAPVNGMQHDPSRNFRLLE